MGLFDSMCIESGIIIDDRQQLIPIIETTKDTWCPIALPIEGTNDRYGTMDMPKKLDANMRLVAAFGKSLTYGDTDVKASRIDLAGMLGEIRADGGKSLFKTKQVSFTLVDGGIYAAIVGAVSKRNATAWRRWAQLGLRTPELPLPNRVKEKKARPPTVDPTTKRLCNAILAAPDDEAPRSVYVDHLLEREEPLGKLLSVLPRLRKLSFEGLAAIAFPETQIVYEHAATADLKPALVALVQFLTWGTRLAPSHGEGQFFGYGPEDPKNDQYADLQGWAQPYVERARQKYAGMPEVLAICDRCEKSFRERGSDDE